MSMSSNSGIIYYLSDWAVVTTCVSPYCSPECYASRQLSGYRTPVNEGESDPNQRISPSAEVVTSKIIKCEGRKVYTRNSIYILKDINPEYRNWLNYNGITLDEDNPIKFRNNQ